LSGMFREAESLVRSNMTLMERQADLLRSYLDTHGLDHDTALQREMIARYLYKVFPDYSGNNLDFIT
jgi:hypothetical protein